MSVRIKNVVLSGHNYGDGLIEASRYRAGGVALRVVDAVTHEPLTILTVWLHVPPTEGAFWLKTWGENDGVMELLGKAGLTEYTGTVAEVNAYGSMALETKPKGELKTLIDEEVASW